MENQQNKSIDNLKDEAVKGSEIKGGNGATLPGGLPNPDPLGLENPTGELTPSNPVTAIGMDDPGNAGNLNGGEAGDTHVLPPMP